ncbi:MAG: 1-acyl-sn-glycerol-3-phosphate acyltransferase, partial [Erysipelotrichales bacterium]|nr:1-acyl-sn-glycerol-3-phosphate acyltransferase [Erysipelotrichales bacterium]
MKRNDNELTPEEFTGRYVRKSSLSYRILRAILTPIAWLLYRPVFHEKEKIPAEGPVLLCTNHRSAADPAFICMSTPRVVHYLAARELFDKIVGFFFRLALCIPVDRKVHTGNPMFAAKTVLSRNEVIGIFPEGKR